MSDPLDLAAIVARDAEIDSGDGFSVMPFVSVAEHDRRALLVLLRETREALRAYASEVLFERGINDPVPEDHDELIARLAALAP